MRHESLQDGVRVALTTNAAFGYGADGNLLYLTAGKFVYAIRMAKQGYQLKRSGRAAVSGRS